MSERSARIEQFTSSVADMKLRDPATGVDRVLTRLGVAGLAAGLACAAAAWFVSHGTRNPLQQRDAIVLALLGVTLAIVGGVLWLKATLAGFLRFWMARFVYEQQAQADRLAAAVTGEASAASAVETTAAPAEGVGPAPATTATAGGRTDVVST
jgi:hypothetical protein